jgi:hypothetical protein
MFPAQPAQHPTNGVSNFLLYTKEQGEAPMGAHPRQGIVQRQNGHAGGSRSPNGLWGPCQWLGALWAAAVVHHGVETGALSTCDNSSIRKTTPLRTLRHVERRHPIDPPEGGGRKKIQLMAEGCKFEAVEGGRGLNLTCLRGAAARGQFLPPPTLRTGCPLAVHQGWYLHSGTGIPRWSPCATTGLHLTLFKPQPLAETTSAGPSPTPQQTWVGAAARATQGWFFSPTVAVMQTVAGTSFWAWRRPREVAWSRVAAAAAVQEDQDPLLMWTVAVGQLQNSRPGPGICTQEWRVFQPSMRRQAMPVVIMEWGGDTRGTCRGQRDRNRMVSHLSPLRQEQGPAAALALRAQSASVEESGTLGLALTLRLLSPAWA